MRGLEGLTLSKEKEGGETWRLEFVADIAVPYSASDDLVVFEVEGVVCVAVYKMDLRCIFLQTNE